MLWKTLHDAFFAPLIDPAGAVLELGAGYCEFINSVRCARRIAVDVWEGMPRYAAAGVEARVGDAADLAFLDDGSVAFVFASNLFEHLTQDALRAVLRALRPKVRPGATLNVVQPNFRYAYREYFDDYTHRTIYTDVGLADLLEAEGLEVIERRPRFLPLSLKSRLPVSAPLIRLYLKSPIKPLAKQMLLRARFS